MKPNSHPYADWYRLDNAAVIFSLITSKDLPAVFRLSVTLDNYIHFDRMQQALDRVIERFPYFRVQLKKGLFWFHLAHNPEKPEIRPDLRDPCQYIPIYDDRTLLFNVRVYGRRVAVEFHHGITDGTGARKFLLALVTEYLELRGFKISSNDIMRPDQSVQPEEYEDAFKRYYDSEIPHLPRYSRAFQLPFNTDPAKKFRVTKGKIDISTIKQVTNKFDVTITELLVAVYLDSLQRIYWALPDEIRQKSSRPIRVSVAINLRNIFPSATMRNFSLHVVAGIDPRLGTYTFDDIVEIVHHSLQVDISKKDLLRQIKRNVRGEMHPLMRVTPLIFKDIFGELIYSLFGERQFSGSFSNLGYIDPDDDLSRHINEFEFVPSRNNVRKVNCGVTGYGDKLIVHFGNTSERPDLERYFFRKLGQLGIPVKIDTNYEVNDSL